MGSNSNAEAADAATCEVCGFDGSVRVLVLCQHYGPNHRVGRHTFCGPGPFFKDKKDDTFTCMGCTTYCRSIKDALDARVEAALQQKGRHTGLEEMPDLNPLRGPAPRVRRGFEAVAQPTEQQRINMAAAAAAAGDDVSPNTKRRKLNSRPGAAAAASGRSACHAAAAAGGDAAGGGASKRGSGGGGGGGASGGGGGAAGRPLQRQPTAKKGFIAALNTGHGAGVRAAQAGAKAAKAARAAAAAAAGGASGGAGEEWADEQDHASAEQDDDWGAVPEHDAEDDADGDDDGGDGQQQQQPQLNQQQQQQQCRHPLQRQPRGLALTVQIADYERQLMCAKLACRLIVLDSEPADQQPGPGVDAESYLHITGHFWCSESEEQQGTPAQQESHKALLEELEEEKGGQPRLHLMGGAFNLATHASVRRFIDDPLLSYKPMLFIPEQAEAKNMVLELLGAPRRVLVMSINNRLLVLAPTRKGELVSVCARDLRWSEELTDDLVKTIMKHPRLGCPSRERAPSHEPNSFSESLLGPAGPPPPPAAEADDEDAEHHPAGSSMDHNDDGMDDNTAQHHQQQQQQEEDQHMDEQQQNEQEQQEDHAAQGGQVVAPAGLEHEEVQGSTLDADASVCGRRGHQQQQRQRRQHNQLQQQQQQDSSVPAQSGRLPVQQLPPGMRMQQQAGEQQQQPAPAAAAAAAEAAANGPAVTLPAAGAGAAGRPVSTRAAVEGSALAQLIRRWGGVSAEQQQQQHPTEPLAEEGAPRQQQQQPLTRRCCIPQLSDLSDVQHLRLYLVGFPPAWLEEEQEEEGELGAQDSSSSSLFGPIITAARGLVDAVHTSSALEDLLQDLGLVGGEHLQLPTSTTPAATATAATRRSTRASPAAGRSGGGAAARRAGSVDVAARALGGDSSSRCCRVLLLPKHFTSQQLQQLLGPVPLWQLLASPVAIFRQGQGQGLLHQLQLIAQQKQNHKQNNKQNHNQKQKKQPEESEEEGSSRLPACLIAHQVYRQGFAAVVDHTTLTHSSIQDIQRLLQLMGRAQQLLYAQQVSSGGLVEGGPCGWQLLLTQETLTRLPADKQQLMREGLRQFTVALLDDLLPPGSLTAAPTAGGDDDDEPTSIIPAALALAAQDEQQLRHVAVIIPDVTPTPSSSQPQSSSVSSGAALAAAAAAGPSKTTPAKQQGNGKGARPRGRPRKSKGASGQQQQHQHQQPAGSEQQGMSRLLRANACLILSAGAQQPRLLTGTLSQLLQLLTDLLGNNTTNNSGPDSDSEGQD